MSDSPEAVVTHPVAPRFAGGKSEKMPHVGPDLAACCAAHAETVGAGSDEWGAAKAREILHWDRPFKMCGATGCDRVAIIYAGSECGITYSELLREVCSLANILTSTFGVTLLRKAIPASSSWASPLSRVDDCASRVLITSNEGRGAGR
ncbi:hypothetical protein B0H13DRAFT_2304091 [Mycena leptocephala]|nr:hypothetical protein B0H13DRAFT_2304091 [Mycena leptocephala]